MNYIAYTQRGLLLRNDNLYCFLDDQFDELREDESSAYFYPKLPRHHKLDHLTTDNVTLFINISKNCLVGFYVPCELGSVY